MARPKILEDLDKKVETSDDEIFDGTLPVDADTLGGLPPEQYALKSEVSQIMMRYMSNILGKSY